MEKTGSLFFEGGIDVDKLYKGIDQMNQKIKQSADHFNKQGGRIGGTFDNIGLSVGRLIGPAIALTAAFKFQQLAREAYQFEKDFGMAMREVQTISKAVQDDFDGISDRIANMAANGPDDAIKLSKAFYQLVSAGYDGEAGLKLLEISSKAATAGITDTLVAADGLTTVLNAWGISADNAGKVADVMFKTVERGKTTFGELASSIAQVAPLAAANNIEFEQIFAALQTITKQGTPTAQAMTQIRSSIVNMNKVLGDGWSNVMTYQDGLNQVAKMAGGSQVKLKELIPDIEGVNAVLALTGQKAVGAAEDLNETAKAAGAMEKAYGTMMLEADNKWGKVHNKWTREIRELGKAIKAGSASFADFLNVLLTDNQLDIIDPGAKKIVDEVAASVSELTDKEEKLTIILAKINELRNKRIGDLQPGIQSNEEQLPGWLRRQVESLNAGIGLGAWATPGRTAQAEFDYLNNQVDITKKAEEGLMKLFTEVSAESEKAGNNVSESLETVHQQIENTQKALAEAKAKLDEFRAPGSTKTVDDIEDQEKVVKGLKDTLETLTGVKQEVEKAEKEITDLNGKINKLYKDLETADEKDRGIIASRIVELEKELQLRRSISDEAVKTAKNEPIKAKSVTSDSIKGTITGQDGKTLFIGKGEYKSLKDVNLEMDKLKKRIADVKKEGDQGKILEQTQEILSNLRGMTSEYAEQLGLSEDQTKLLDDAMQTVSGIADIAQGNVIQGAAKLIDSAVSMFVKAPEKFSEEFEKVAEHVDKMIKSINIAVESLSNINVDSSATTLALLKKELSDLAKEAEKLNTALPGNTRTGRRETPVYNYDVKDTVKQVSDLRAEIERLSLILLNGGISDEQRKAIEAVLESYNNLMAQMDSIIQDTIGTSIVDFKSSLADAFFEAEDVAKSWGDTVNDIIANIAKNQLITKLLTAPIEDAINQLLNDYSDNNLSTDEIKKFQDAMSSIYSEVGPAFEEAIKGFENMGIDFGSSNKAATVGLSGAIRRELTEETGGELAGLWRKSSDDTRQIRDYGKISVNHLVKIEANTYNTVVELKNAVSELKDSNAKLEQVVSNTKQAQTDRDLGV